MTGTATAYALPADNGSIITSNITAPGCSQEQYGYPYSSGCNYIWRYDQPVQVATQSYTNADSPDGVATAAVTLDTAGNGTWSSARTRLPSTISAIPLMPEALDPALLLGSDGFDVPFSWAMTCANDIIQGVADSPAIPVPEPSSLLLIGSSIAGLAIARRRGKNHEPRES